MADVSARVETIRPGDRVYRPLGREAGYEVERVESYDDGTHVVVYRTGESSRMRFGDTVLSTPNVLASFAAMQTGDRLRCRRGSSSA
jgi:hypothetical protein